MRDRGQDTSPARRPGRPKDPAKREAILDAAQRLFYARGVGPVGLEDVAGQAGVSRMTLYSHFGGKPALLSAVVERESARALAAMDEVQPGDGGSLRDRLLAFARAYLALVTRPDIVAFDRLLTTEAREQPELVTRFLAAGPDRLKGRLAGVLRERVPERGDRADRDAGRLIALLVGDLLLLERYGQLPPFRPGELSERAEGAVEFFLGGIGAKRDR